MTRAAPECPSEFVHAPCVLQQAIDAISSRARERDTEATGERSMSRAVAIYKAVKGSPAMATAADGWLFMVCLKLARAYNNPAFTEDDFVDASAYIALLAEELGR